MSFEQRSSSALLLLHQPVIVASAGVILAIGFPLIPPSSFPLGFLKVANLFAFITNVVAVSIPGRIDGERARRLAEGYTDPTATSEESPLLVTGPSSSSSSLLPEQRDSAHRSPMELRDRTLVRPAAWAFSIWAAIYLGEAALVVAQFVPAASELEKSLSYISVPFVAANLLQSLWCASFRPSFDEGWHRFVSCFMLGATAYALSYIPAQDSWFNVPLAAHFGWTSAATLVNLNGSIASDRQLPDLSLVAVGHSSVVLATVLGIGISIFGVSTSVYAFTIAWALAAIASGVQLQEYEQDWSDALQSGARVQRALAWTGSVLCITAGAFTLYIH